MILYLATLFVMLAGIGSGLVLIIPPLRRALLTRTLFKTYKNVLPQMS